jgi:hypothetical protein
MADFNQNFPNWIWDEIAADRCNGIKGEHDIALTKVEAEADKDETCLNQYRERNGLTEGEYDEEQYQHNMEQGWEGYPDIITQFARWAITTRGLESLRYERYFISIARLDDTDWAAHMTEKLTADDYQDFVRALYHARKIHSYLKFKATKAEVDC